MLLLSITTTDGEPIVLIVHPVVSNMTVMSVNNTEFVIFENAARRPKYDDYVIPKDYMNITMSVIMGERNMTDDMLQHFDNTTVNETRQSVLHDLAMSDEAVLIIAAAQALVSWSTGNRLSSSNALLPIRTTTCKCSERYRRRQQYSWGQL